MSVAYRRGGAHATAKAGAQCACGGLGGAGRNQKGGASERNGKRAGGDEGGALSAINRDQNRHLWHRSKPVGRGGNGRRLAGRAAHQPIHRINVPSACRTVEWPGMGIGLELPRREHSRLPPTLSEAATNRPWRGPIMYAPQSAAVPPVRWTTPLPAKSSEPPSTLREWAETRGDATGEGLGCGGPWEGRGAGGVARYVPWP